MMLLRSDDESGPGYAELVDDGIHPPRWWLPALVHLAIARTDLPSTARDELEAWAARRQDCVYTVVQEETDDHLSLTASSWPVVDDRGRLRFAVSADPVELHAERDQLQAFVTAQRGRWHQLGLVGPEQAGRPLQLGDTFAIWFRRPDGTPLRLVDGRPLHRRSNPTELGLEPAGPDDPTVMHLIATTRSPTNARTSRAVVATTVGQLVDITWDARQAGKIAQLAAFSGVLQPAGEPTAGAPGASFGDAAVPATPSGDDELIAEGLDRQLQAFVAGLDPDDALRLGSPTDTAAAG